MEHISANQFLSRRLAQADFHLDEIRDLIPVILRHLPSTIESVHLFFRFKDTISGMAADLRLPYQQARDAAIRNPKILFDRHNISFIASPFPPNICFAKALELAAAQEGDVVLRTDRRKTHISPINFDDLEAAIRDAMSDGENIEMNEKIATGELAGTTFRAVNKRMMTNAANDPNYEYGSISILMKARGIERFPSSCRFKSIDFDDLKKAIEHAQKNGPFRLQDRVGYGKYKGQKWLIAYNDIYSYGRRNPDCGFTTLNEFMEQQGIKKLQITQKKRSPLTADSLAQASRDYFTEGKSMPRLSDNEHKIGPFRLRVIKEAFRDSVLEGIENYKTESGSIPACYQEFLGAAGILKPAHMIPELPVLEMT